MAGFFAIQYWVIWFLMVGLCCSRPHVSRMAFSAVTFAIGRFFVRSVAIWIGGSANPVSGALGNEYFILLVNFVVLGVLFAEMITGHREKHRKRALVKSERVNE